jgi:hypothetical protein
VNKDKFISYIERPELLNADSIASLESLLKEFPYCQTSQLLFTRNLGNQEDIRFNNQLKIAGAYAGDRRKLYELIRKKPLETASPFNGTEAKEEIKPVAKEEIKITSAKKERSPEEILREALAELDAKKKAEEAKKLAEESVAAKAKKEQEEKERIEKENTLAKEKALAAEALAKAEKEALALAEQLKLEESKAEIKVTEPEIKMTGDEKFDEVEELKQELNTLDEQYTTQAIESSVEMDIFEAEAELNKQIETDLKKNIQEDIQKKKEEAEKADPNKKLSFTDWLRIKQAPAEGENKEPDITKDLIEKFIQEQPRISKPKTEFYSPVNMARQSVTDDGELVTETLAKVYVQQGAYAQALKAYETLSLLNPQKKVYFAARIEEIKKLIN